MVLLMLCPRAFLWALQGLARAKDTAHSAPHSNRRQSLTAGRAGRRQKIAASSASDSGSAAGQAIERQAARFQAAGRAGDSGRAARQAKRQRGRREAGKTGKFCNTFAHKNGLQTDTRPVRTRVYPVILYARPVILGPKKPISHLRILKKKI